MVVEEQVWLLQLLAHKFSMLVVEVVEMKLAAEALPEH
jgi:hypothetical protein